MRFSIVIVALVAVGCGSTHSDEQMSPALDGNIDDSSQDSGLIIVDETGGLFDAGRTPDGDGGTNGPDSGHPLVDAAVGDDAGADAGTDAAVETSVGMCTGDLSEPATFGSAEHPVALAAGDVTFEGEIDWRGRAFARITGVTPGTRYVITASAASRLVLSAFPDDTTFTEAACVSGDDVTEFNSLCLVTATGTSIDVAIDALEVSAVFTLTIKPAYASEGTTAAPIELAHSALPYDLEVNSESANYYEITGLTPSLPYVVSVRASADFVRVSVYENGAFSGSPTDQGSEYASAIGTPQGTSLFVALRAWGPGTTAQLDVRPATHESEGSAGAPIQIASSALPFEGEVGWSYHATPHPIPVSQNGGSESFYRITGLTPGAYVVTLDDVTTPVFVLLEDPDYGHVPYTHLPYWVSAREDVPARIATRISGSTLDLSIKNEGGAGTTFTLDLEPATRTSVGTQAEPLQVPLEALPYTGEIEPNTYSYYEITGLTAGQPYLARASNVTEAGVGLLFEVEGSLDVCEIQTQTGTSGLTCTVVPNRTSALVHARVFGYTDAAVVGSVFTLSLEPIIEQSFGTPEAPIVIDCPSGTYTSEIGTNGYSYYEITGLEAGVVYLVEATQPGDNDTVISVFTGSNEQPFYDPTNTYCRSYGTPSRCVSTSAEGSLFVEAIGYLRGQPIELKWRRAAMGSEGTESAPVELGPTDFPYAGQVSGAGPSFYAISGLAPDTEYVVRVTPVEERLDVNLYASVGFENEVGVGPVFPGEPFERTFTTLDTTAYLKIALPIGTDAIGTFEVEVSRP